jgi:SOS-response transcriptional repressor LexA
MEREPTTQTQTEPSGLDGDMLDIDATEVAQRGQSVIELSRELNSSSKALLEQIDPVA